MFEINAAPVFVEFRRKLVDPRQRMHHHGVLKALFQEKLPTDGRVAGDGCAFFHALFLFASHVKSVVTQTGRHGAQLGLNDLVDLGVERQLMRLLGR
ncbi:hypothetical protein D3C83_05300 [compost metagenome]